MVSSSATREAQQEIALAADCSSLSGSNSADSILIHYISFWMMQR